MSSTASSVILTCKADVVMPDIQRDALCQAVHTALASRVGADRLHPLAAPDDVAGSGRALHITLRLTRADPRTIEGHLEWARNGQIVTGPPITLSVDDMPLGPALYPSFANGLMQVSELPL